MNMTKLLFCVLCFSCLALGVKGQEKFPLSSLNLRMMSVGFGNVRADVASSGKPITLQGKQYKGVGTHAESKMLIKLDGKGNRFRALVGVDDAAGGPGTVMFRVVGDGKELFNSGIMKCGDRPKKIDVKLKGINKLMLEALPTADGKNFDHADWADAEITMDEGKPLAIPDCELVTVSTEGLDLVFRVDKNGNFFQQYFGERGGFEKIFAGGTPKDQAYPTINSNSEFTYWGEPALHVLHADGHMSTVLKYQGVKTEEVSPGVWLTRVTLKDPNYEFYTDLCFQSFGKTDVIQQWSEIYHQEGKPVTLKNFASAALAFHSREYWLTQFTGEWANEFRVDELKLEKGSKVLENKWGITSSNGRQQHFMISLDGKPSENAGRVVAASLAWSGNYKLQFEVDGQGRLTALAGMNPWASDYTLEAGKRFVTPRLIYTYSASGKGQASRNLHHWAIEYGIRDGKTPLRTIFNNWEATGMNTADSKIVPFFKPAHDLGFELFLLDDGWFGLPNKARVLGEWEPTPVMHPNGLKVLVTEAGKAGIDFGLWVEMEMANPDARLVKEHPEWLLCEPKREKHLQRGQYVLDLSNPEVQKFCIEAFDKILRDNPGISFVKWDCNSPFHNPYSHYLGNNQQHLWIEYTQGLYHIFSEVVRLQPNLQMMLCSAGGARSDYGSMRYFHEFWASDNTTPLSRVYIQWGYSHIFPSKTVGAHVTHMGNQPFKFAFDVAMSGCLGMDADPTKMNEEEKKITKRSVELYKTRLRNTVQFGDLYRLLSPYETSRASLMYVEPEKKAKAVLFVYQVRDAGEDCVVRLEGLDAGKQYRVEEVNIDSPEKAACRENGKMISGEELMKQGLTFSCKKRFDSAVVCLEVQ